MTLGALALFAALHQTPSGGWSAAVHVGAGQSHVAKGAHLVVGRWYVLTTEGHCATTERGRYRRWRQGINPNPGTPFGNEYRISIGRLDFPAGIERHEVEFRADQEFPVVRIEDRSSAVTGLRCTLTSVAIRPR